jgi:hypothetical protein
MAKASKREERKEDKKEDLKKAGKDGKKAWPPVKKGK